MTAPHPDTRNPAATDGEAVSTAGLDNLIAAARRSIAGQPTF